MLGGDMKFSRFKLHAYMKVAHHIHLHYHFYFVELILLLRSSHDHCRFTQNLNNKFQKCQAKCPVHKTYYAGIMLDAFATYQSSCMLKIMLA